MTETRDQVSPSIPPGATTVARFEIPYFHCLDPQGVPQSPVPPFGLDFERLKALYRMMVLVRTLDQRAVTLQRTGQLGTYACCLGQEAVGTAIGDAMKAEDVLLPSYRETPALLMRGVTMEQILLYWGGDERGMAFSQNREDFPFCIPIATHAPHAVGVAKAFQFRRQPRVAVCVLGDGATSKGDFYEALNVAGVWRLPLVFVVVNNQWAISVPRHSQTGTETLAQKAIAAGIHCELVDGNDLIILRERLGIALDAARHGVPQLIEAKTYRLGDHTTADDASRYRSEEELQRHWALEPITRLRRYLERAGEWHQNQEDSLKSACQTEVEQAVERYLATPPPSADDMFDYLYETFPAGLEWQRIQAREAGHGCG